MICSLTSLADISYGYVLASFRCQHPGIRAPKPTVKGYIQINKVVINIEKELAEQNEILMKAA